VVGAGTREKLICMNSKKMRINLKNQLIALTSFALITLGTIIGVLVTKFDKDGLLIFGIM
jgi:hypothetical protein